MMMRRVAAESHVPPWLEQLLTTQFFATCPDHAEAARSESNLFCLDCPDAAAFCFYCRSRSHSSHRVIQIRRSSYHDVVRVSEVERSLDVSGVQTYVINSARVVFLNERPQPRGGAGKPAASPHTCEICSRSLLDPFRFCSLGCKLVGTTRTLSSDEASGSRGGNLTAGSDHRDGPARPPQPSSRRRKGVPHRAPFNS